MSTLTDTAYPHLNPEPSTKEIRDFYTPAPDEITFIAQIAKRPLQRTVAMLHLKLFQRLGQFAKTGQLPQVARTHVAQCLVQSGLVVLAPTLKAIQQFEKSGGFKAIVNALRNFLNVRPVTASDLEWLQTIAAGAAEIKHSVEDIINVMLEELVHHRFELPAFSTLDRMAYQAREASNQRHFSAIAQQLTPQTRALIDKLLTREPGESTSGWQTLKREPKRPTNKETRSYLQLVRYLQTLVEQLPKPEVAVPKLRQFRHLARALDASEMAELKPEKRYALAVILIRSRHAQALDDSAELLIRLVQNLENAAREKLLSFQQDRILKVDMLLRQLREILDALDTPGSYKKRVEAITSALKGKIGALKADCDEILAYAGRNSLPFMLEPYRAVRSQLLNCVEITDPQSSSEDTTSRSMISALGLLRSNRSQFVTLADAGLKSETQLNWMSAQWRKLVIVHGRDKVQTAMLHRTYFELAVLQQVKEEFKTGDLFIKFGERYDDFREQLVDEETCKQELPHYADVTGIDIVAADFVANLKAKLQSRAEKVDSEFPANAHAEIVDGRLVLRKPPRSDIAEDVVALEAAVTQRMTQVGIVDVLSDVVRWLELHKHFKPLAGTDSRLEDLRMRVITTLFCYGCNLGPVQTARSIKGLSRRQIAWLNLKYVTEDTLEKAIVSVINAYQKFDLPGYWGTGEHVSADGTKWNLYEQNMVSEYHIRYGGYGEIGYYHVSDKLIALFSHFIACGTYEGV
jgi:hypothetical protein